jgi:hypothetical protein
MPVNPSTGPSSRHSCGSTRSPYPIKKKLEIYGATSWIFGDKDAGFST